MSGIEVILNKVLAILVLYNENLNSRCATISNKPPKTPIATIFKTFFII